MMFIDDNGYVIYTRAELIMNNRKNKYGRN